MSDVEVEGVSVPLSGLTSDVEIPVLNFPLLPTLIITATAYLISSCFFSVYEMAIDTLFLCFLQDSEINDGSKQKPFFMSKYRYRNVTQNHFFKVYRSRKLMKILGKKNVAEEEKKNN